MPSELSCAGILWLTLSTLAALGASTGFFLPYWLRGTFPPSPLSSSSSSASSPPSPTGLHHTPQLPRGGGGRQLPRPHPHFPSPSSSPRTPPNPLRHPTPVYLNSWRRCNYPRLVPVVSRDGDYHVGGGSSGGGSSSSNSRSNSYYDYNDDDGGGGHGGGGGSNVGRQSGRGRARGVGAAASPSHPAGVVELVPECGRYTHFLDIPSLWWQAGTVICGTGSALALLVAMAGAWALCVRHVLTKGTARLAAALQFTAGVLIGGGVALYPLGWDSPEVRQVCGPSASAFRLGDCELYWAFYLTASAGGVTLLCSMLAICAPSSKAQYS